MPPSTATNDNGIITEEAERPSRPASACMMGMNITTTGMLLRAALITITTKRTIRIERAALPPTAKTNWAA